MKISNHQFNFTPQGNRKRTKHKISRIKKTIKIIAEINEMENRKLFKSQKKQELRFN